MEAWENKSQISQEVRKHSLNILKISCVKCNFVKFDMSTISAPNYQPRLLI